MHSFVRYRDLLPFELVGVADPPAKGLVGRDAGEAIGSAAIGIRIAPKIADAIEGADTLIVGYVDELSRISGRDVLREAVQLAIDRGISVYSFVPLPADDELRSLASRRGCRIESPTISLASIAEAPEDASSRVDVPVVGVFGTSSQQGKFTLQLALRRRLLALGYRVGQIGTEHQSELFGMDLGFPIAYDSPLDLPIQHHAPFLQVKTRQIAATGPDIIIVGAQSGTVPYDVEKLSTHSLPALALLLGTQPDACILVVNSIDPDEYIRDSIDAIRAIGKAPVIGLAMSDKEKHVRAAHQRSWVGWRQLDPEAIAARLAALEDRFAIPSTDILSDEGQARMTQTVLRYFSAEGA